MYKTFTKGCNELFKQQQIMGDRNILDLAMYLNGIN